MIPWRRYDSQRPLFWRGLSGTNSGGLFAPGRFCLLPKLFFLELILALHYILFTAYFFAAEISSLYITFLDRNPKVAPPFVFTTLH